MKIISCFVVVQILSRIVNRLVSHRVLYAIEPEKLSRYQLLQARDKFRSNPDLQVTMVTLMHAAIIVVNHVKKFLVTILL